MKELDAQEYHLWSLPSIGEITSDGKWMTYRINYEKADTLTVKGIEGGKNYQFASGFNGRFFDRGMFACQTKDSLLSIVNLKTGNKKSFDKVTDYAVAGRYLLILRQENGLKSLIISDATAKKRYTEKNIIEFKISPDNNMVAVTIYTDGSYFVKNITLGERILIHHIYQNASAQCKRLTWSSDSKSLAFLQIGDKSSELYCYRLDGEKMISFGPSDKTNFPKNSYIDAGQPLDFSKDNQRIFFKMRQVIIPTNTTGKSDVQIWNAADKWIYSAEQIIKGWTVNPKIGMFEPDTERFLFITDTIFPKGFLTADKRYSVSYNPKEYEPQTKPKADVDLYLTELSTNKKEMLLKRFRGDDDNILLSPTGKYLSYFKEKCWFVFDVGKKTHLNLTAEWKIPLDEVEFDMAGESPAYGLAGWMANEKKMLIYDQFDIWAVAADGSGKQKLTNGRERGVVFRIVPQNDTERGSSDNHHTILGNYDLGKGIVLRATTSNHLKNGIFYLTTKSLQEIVFKEKGIYNITKANKANTFAWIEENYNNAPQIMTSNEAQKPKILLATNPQHHNYFSHEAEVINYTNANGKTLQGMLYYPYNYEVGKKFPMVMHIYEKQFAEIHRFIRPSLYNSTGFNIANLTAQGYFVFLPDITYTMGNIGDSALNCVEAAVLAVVQKEEINEEKIGLIGHSFGGFETNYIIAKSKLFACAVAGSAPTNYISNYLSEAKNTKQPNFFMIEYGQARMGKSLFDDTDIYLRNSPVLLVAGITTPLLSWTGLKDYQVNYTQSFEFYMAMRRLGKFHILLAFPDEGHGILDRTRDADLTEKIEQWFAYFLKDKNKPNWINPT
ncbi:prolyl oligopeptidase family serine peptidase [Flavobacterium weaverense]